MTKHFYAVHANDRVYLRSSESIYFSASLSPNYGGTVTFHRDDRGPLRARRITSEQYREWHDWAVRRYAESAAGTAGVNMTPANNWVAATPEVLASLGLA
jgi:hypothetical protein